jgi:hypothetical protein
MKYGIDNKPIKAEYNNDDEDEEEENIKGGL